ncbi:YncE family protein, partial [Thermus sp.]
MEKLNRRTALKVLGAVGMAAMARTQAQGQAPKPVWSPYVVFLNANAKAFIVDTRTDQVVASLDTAKGATLGSMTPDAKKVYVSGAGEGETRVVVLDLENLRVAKVLETGNRPKHGLVSPDGQRVGVDHWGLSDGKLRLVFLRTADDTVEKILEISVSGTPKGVTSMHNAWSWDSRFFYSVDRVDDRLIVVDTQDWSYRTVPMPSVPHYPVVSPDGARKTDEGRAMAGLRAGKARKKLAQLRIGMVLTEQP